MKSFLNFISFTFFSLFIIGLFAFLLKGDFKDFQVNIILFISFLFSATSFTYFYVYSQLFSNKKIIFRTLLSVLAFVVIFFSGAIVFQYYFLKEINLMTLFFQCIIGICIFLLETLLLEFYKSNKTGSALSFSDSILFYLKSVFLLSVFQTFLLALFFMDKMLETRFEFRYLFELKNILFEILVMNILTISCLFLCNKWKLVQANNPIKIVCSTLITFLLFIYFGSSFFIINRVILIISFIIVLFSNLFLFLFIRFRDNNKTSELKYQNLTKDFSQKEAEYLELKNQINPHFLFNNINTLITFIELNPDKAIAFAHNLANVYRHYLKNQSEDFVLLESEIDFISQYLEIYKAKFESGFNYNIKANKVDFYVLSSSLQEIIDNIFKHNVMDDSLTIQINIYTENDYLIIQNTVEEKVIETSDQSGLKNINKRYEILIQKSIETNCDSGVFSVKLPILKLQ
jgi:two-component system LytT family sensor kinase